jgi:pilus assembly protein CpaE
VLVVANNVQNAVVEITRKDFESTIERKIDLMLPADPKAMAQAAKLGKPVVEAVRSSRLSLGIAALAEMIAGSSAETAEADAAATKVKAKKSAFAGFKNMLKKK